MLIFPPVLSTVACAQCYRHDHATSKLAASSVDLNIKLNLDVWDRCLVPQVALTRGQQAGGLGPDCGHLGTILGHLGQRRGYFGPVWAILRPSWGHLGQQKAVLES